VNSRQFINASLTFLVFCATVCAFEEIWNYFAAFCVVIFFIGIVLIATKP